MTTVFLTLLNMAVSAGFLVAAVVVARLLLKNAPKTVFLVLWAMVAVRLLCPFSLQSPFSLIPTLPSPAAVTTVPSEDLSAVSAVNVSDSSAPSALTIATVIWLCGVAVMLIYTAVRYALVHHRVREAALRENRVYVCDRIDTAFILGVLRPRIYLPSSLKKRDRKYVLAHERSHLRRGDPWWKILGFLLLSVYWFHPLMWVAYILFCRDLELACDEKVIREQGVKIKKAYAQALINCSEPRKAWAFCPLAFGEIGVRSRIKAVLCYKKPTVWIVGAAVILCVAVAACFLTDPLASRAEDTAAVQTVTTTAPAPAVTTTTTAPAPAVTTTTTAPPTTTTVSPTTTAVATAAPAVYAAAPTAVYTAPMTTTMSQQHVCIVDEEYMSSVNQSIYDQLCTTMTQYKYNPYQVQPSQPYVPDGRATVPQVPSPPHLSSGADPIM